MISIALFGIFLVGVMTFYAGNQRVHSVGQSQVETQQTGRVMLERLQRELRTCGYDPEDVISGLSPTTALRAGDVTSVTFVADVDTDGTTDQVTYSLSGFNLRRDVSSWNGTTFPTPSGGVVGEGVSAFAMTFFDRNDAALSLPLTSSDLDDVRRISIGLTTSHRTRGADQQNHDLTVDVRLRNTR